MAAEFTLDTKALRAALDLSLKAATVFAKDKITEITPRDLERLPQDINRKDGKEPHRSSHYKPVNIGGNWYEWVTGTLKRSIGDEKAGDMRYAVGVVRWPASEYAEYLEFGTQNMSPRPFIRKGIADNIGAIREEFQSTFARLTK